MKMKSKEERKEKTDVDCSLWNWSKYAKVYDPIKCASIDGTDTEPHDRAVVRAINSSYKPNRFVKGRPECTIFISRLNHETSKDTIKEIFSKYGKLRRFRLVKDIVTGMPKGYAFVEFEEEHAAEDAYRLANKMAVDGNIIFVDFECERLLKGWKPRRLGGGFAGKKESGQLRFGGRDRPFKKPIALEIRERQENKKRLDEESRHRREKSRRQKSPNETNRRSPLVNKEKHGSPPRKSLKPNSSVRESRYHSQRQERNIPHHSQERGKPSLTRKQIKARSSSPQHTTTLEIARDLTNVTNRNYKRLSPSRSGSNKDNRRKSPAEYHKHEQTKLENCRKKYPTPSNARNVEPSSESKIDNYDRDDRNITSYSHNQKSFPSSKDYYDESNSKGHVRNRSPARLTSNSLDRSREFSPRYFLTRQYLSPEYSKYSPKNSRSVSSQNNLDNEFYREPRFSNSNSGSYYLLSQDSNVPSSNNIENIQTISNNVGEYPPSTDISEYFPSTNENERYNYPSYSSNGDSNMYDFRYKENTNNSSGYEDTQYHQRQEYKRHWESSNQDRDERFPYNREGPAK